MRRLTLNDVINYYQSEIDSFHEQKAFIEERLSAARRASSPELVIKWLEEQLELCNKQLCEARKGREGIQREWLDLKPNAVCATKPHQVRGLSFFG